MSNIQLDELSYLRIRAALQAKDIFELRIKEAGSQITSAINDAFIQAGLDPSKTYTIDPDPITQTWSATEVDSHKE